MGSIRTTATITIMNRRGGGPGGEREGQGEIVVLGAGAVDGEGFQFLGELVEVGDFRGEAEGSGFEEDAEVEVFGVWRGRRGRGRDLQGRVTRILNGRGTRTARAASIAEVGRSAKPNWAKLTPLAGGVRCANWRFGEGATNGNVE